MFILRVIAIGLLVVAFGANCFLMWKLKGLRRILSSRAWLLIMGGFLLAFIFSAMLIISSLQGRSGVCRDVCAECRQCQQVQTSTVYRIGFGFSALAIYAGSSIIFAVGFTIFNKDLKAKQVEEQNARERLKRLLRQ